MQKLWFLVRNIADGLEVSCEVWKERLQHDTQLLQNLDMISDGDTGASTIALNILRIIMQTSGFLTPI